MEVYNPDVVIIHAEIKEPLKHLARVTNFFHSINTRMRHYFRFDFVDPKEEHPKYTECWPSFVEIHYGLEKYDAYMEKNYKGRNVRYCFAHGVVFHYILFAPADLFPVIIKWVDRWVKANKYIQKYEIYVGKDVT